MRIVSMCGQWNGPWNAELRGGGTGSGECFDHSDPDAQTDGCYKYHRDAVELVGFFGGNGTGVFYRNGEMFDMEDQ